MCRRVVKAWTFMVETRRRDDDGQPESVHWT
jgi:hypothetical protein